MGNFFNIDNPFFTAMSKACDIVLLSVVYVILCVPIITIGPATTALYYSIVKVIRRERGYVFREFFKSFKQNFKTGFGLTVILVAAYLILYVDRTYAAAMLKMQGNSQTMGLILLCVFNAIGLILICVTVYIFPVLSRFTLKAKDVMKTSAFIAVKHLPSTVLLVVLVGGSILVTQVFMFPVVFMPGVCCLICSFLIERILKKYMPKSEGNPEETGKDEWYLE